jgi:NitT/TauT family transport system permease protein
MAETRPDVRPAVITVSDHDGDVVVPVAAPDAAIAAEQRTLGRVLARGRNLIAPLVSFVVLIGFWEMASRRGWVSDLVLPAPSDIAVAFADLFSSGLVWPHLRVTLYETVVGFLLGAGAAFVLAVLSSFWPWFRRIISPYMIALQVTPRVALAPIFITWFGFGTQPKVIMAATICFFPVFINTLTGLLTTDEATLEMFHSMRANKRQVFVHFTLPSALPITFAGLKTGITLALIGAIVGEFVATSEGLGMLIDRFTFQLAMDYSFAVLILLMVVGLVLYGLMEIIDRKIVFWTHEDRIAKRGLRSRRQQKGRQA